MEMPKRRDQLDSCFVFFIFKQEKELSSHETENGHRQSLTVQFSPSNTAKINIVFFFSSKQKPAAHHGHIYTGSGDYRNHGPRAYFARFFFCLAASRNVCHQLPPWDLSWPCKALAPNTNMLFSVNFKCVFKTLGGNRIPVENTQCSIHIFFSR